MNRKIILTMFILSLLLVGCGNVSDNEKDQLVATITEDNIISKYIDNTRESALRLSKGDFNKELGVIEYSFFGDVNKTFYKLNDGQKHYIVKEIAKNVTKEGNIECSGSKSCRITTVMLTFIGEDTGVESYYYNTEYDTFMIDSESIRDYEIVN
ncbi:hypothetical protein ACDI16_10310 [Oceanobacillus caeni]